MQKEMDPIYYTTPVKGDFDPVLTFYDVLGALGFSIRQETREPEDHYLRVIGKREERERVERIWGLYRELPVNHLFRVVENPVIENSVGVPGNIPDQWVHDNTQLVVRSLKRAHLRKAAILELLFRPDSAELERSRAAQIPEPALDPEGLGIVIYNHVQAILSVHSELKPDQKGLNGNTWN